MNIEEMKKADMFVSLFKNGLQFVVLDDEGNPESLQKHYRDITFSYDLTGTSSSMPKDKWLGLRDGISCSLGIFLKGKMRLATSNERKLFNKDEVEVFMGTVNTLEEVLALIQAGCVYSQKIPERNWNTYYRMDKGIMYVAHNDDQGWSECDSPINFIIQGIMWGTIKRDSKDAPKFEIV